MLVNDKKKEEEELVHFFNYYFAIVPSPRDACRCRVKKRLRTVQPFPQFVLALLASLPAPQQVAPRRCSAESARRISSQKESCRRVEFDLLRVADWGCCCAAGCGGGEKAVALAAAVGAGKGGGGGGGEFPANSRANVIIDSNSS